MSDSDTAARPAPRDVIRAVHLLTRVPLPGGDGIRTAASAWAWPVVGAVVALVQIGIGTAALTVGLSPAVAAGLAIVAGVFLTGALHEDGFADCADGFWGGHTPERRLEILKDSRIGAYGVVAMITGIGLRWALFAALLPVAPFVVLVAAMLSRAAMAAVMAWLPFARPEGLAAHVGGPPVWSVGLGIVIALGSGFIAVGPGALAAALACSGAAFAVGAVARAKIGGQTGDVLGASQVTAELAVLLTLAALLN